MNSIPKRFWISIKNALPKSKKTILWLLKIILPVSLAVCLMQYWGVIEFISQYLTPAFSIVGLPGEAAIVFISSIFLALYAPIAIIATLPLDMREITILALMCLISHNMFVESAIQKKAGSSFIVMFSVRILFSFIAAYLLNMFLPAHMGKQMDSQDAVVFHDLSSMLLHWLKGAGALILKITLIVSGLMILQSILREFRIMNYLSKLFAPAMRVFGLSSDSSFLWIVGQIVGLTYGSAILIEQVENKEISSVNANYLNYHIAINHSLLEDTSLFIAIGVPAAWLIIPRFLLATFLVWTVRLIEKQFKSKKLNPTI